MLLMQLSIMQIVQSHLALAG